LELELELEVPEGVEEAEAALVAAEELEARARQAAADRLRVLEVVVAALVVLV
jgi:type IV pilus biogenesis protein CpaD/CtpE